MKVQALGDVIKFWFMELNEKDWFIRNARVDQQISDRFGALYEALASAAPTAREAPLDTLACIIVLDQFPRNLYRNSAKAFGTDNLALHLSKAGIAAGQDEPLSAPQKAFFYMPFMHSEDADDQVRSVALFNAPGLQSNYDFARSHKAIIDRFGRYPHRNAVLGRKSTQEEIQFLQQPDSSF